MVTKEAIEANPGMRTNGSRTTIDRKRAVFVATEAAKEVGSYVGPGAAGRRRSKVQLGETLRGPARGHVGDAGGRDMVTEAKLSLIRRAAALECEIERLEAKLSRDENVDLDCLWTGCKPPSRIIRDDWHRAQAARRDAYFRRLLGNQIWLRRRAKHLALSKCVEDPALFGRFFRDQGTWEVWKAYLAGLFAVPMEPERLALFQKYTGRTTAPQFEFDKSFLVCGRRSGKSVILAVLPAIWAASATTGSSCRRAKLAASELWLPISRNPKRSLALSADYCWKARY